MYNPDNPYVINPYFYSNITTLHYNQTWLSTIHTLNNWIAFVLGLSTTLLLIYLIFKKTPKSFKDYSRLILLTAIVDLVYVVINFLIQVVSFC